MTPVTCRRASIFPREPGRVCAIPHRAVARRGPDYVCWGADTGDRVREPARATVHSGRESCYAETCCADTPDRLVLALHVS